MDAAKVSTRADQVFVQTESGQQCGRGSYLQRNCGQKHEVERREAGVEPICLTAFRRVLRGRSYDKVRETRGRKRSLRQKQDNTYVRV